MVNVWREPIFDRTLDDVNFAIQKLKEWKQNHTHSVDIKVQDDTLVVRDGGTAYVDDERFVLQNDGAVYVENDVLMVNVGSVYDVKGCLNLLDLNRIESNIAYLAEKLESFTYHPDVRYRQWAREDMPNQNDLSRIVANIRSIIESFYQPSDAPPLPTTMLYYTDINEIEENLYSIKNLLDCMQNSFGKVGARKSGATMFLPIRR